MGMDARNVLRALGLGLALAWVSAGNAQETSVSVRQTLDTVQVFGTSNVLERVQEPNAILEADKLRYDSLGLTGTNLRACQLTSAQGLFCLDGNTVRQWRNTKNPGPGEPLFECRDIDVLDPRAADLCTGLTVESSGEVLWIAGRNKSKTFTLLRVSATEPASCPGPKAPLKDFSNSGAGLPYYYCVWATGRPVLVDISPVEGGVAENFQVCDTTGCGSGKGILSVEERRRVVFFPTEDPSAAPGRSFEVASGRTGWSLSGNEQLSAASVLQLESSPGSFSNFVLATSNRGRILSAPTTSSAPATQVVQLTVCSGTGPQYGIRTSAKSGLVYATNRLCRSIVVYDPTIATAASAPTLSPVTGETESLSLMPNGPTIAAGRGFSAAECETLGTCDLIVADNGTPSVTLIGVNVDDPDRSGVILFQVKNLPDCRWLRQAERDGGPAAPAICTADTVYGASDAAGQYLNVTPLLPREIRDLYASDPLPPLYVSPQYRAQPENNFLFEALFAKPEEGLVYRDTFELEFEVGLLTGREFACRSSSNNNLPSGSDAERLRQLLEWDVASKVSENFQGIGPDGLRYDSVINFECGSSRTIVGRSSFFPYNLVITPDTFVGGRLVRDNDAVFAHLLVDLYDQLGAVLRTYAGVSGDGQSSGPPLSSTDFNALSSRWDNGKVLLDRCFEATLAPRQNAAPNNCQSFLSQLTEFRDRLAGSADCSPEGAAIDCDPANRRGELEARATVIDFVYRDRFVPSVTAQGFCDGRTGISGTTC
jgi:hypothetical protein